MRRFLGLVVTLGGSVAISSDHSRCVDPRAPLHFAPAADALDLKSLLTDSSLGFQPQCCCTLRGTAEDHDLTGAAQSGISFKRGGDDYEVYIRLSLNSFLYAGLAKKKDDGSLLVTGADPKGVMLIKPNTTDGWDWSAWENGVSVGSGTMN